MNLNYFSNIIIKYYYKFLQYLNILKLLPFFLLGIFNVNKGFTKYCKTNDDNIRIKYTNKFMNYFYIGLNFSVRNQIKILRNEKIELEKITIINSNHLHPNDLFVLFHILGKNKIKGSQISSISTSHNINDIDKKFLKLNEACMVNNTKDDINSIINKFKYWNNRNYKTLLITFFEGTSQFVTDNKSKKYNYILEPKKLGFNLCLKNNKSKFIYDLNIVYTNNNELIKPKDENFLFLLFHPLTKIYVEIYKYKLPEYKNASLWLDKLYQKKDQQINNIIKKNIG